MIEEESHMDALEGKRCGLGWVGLCCVGWAVGVFLREGWLLLLGGVVG